MSARQREFWGNFVLGLLAIFVVFGVVSMIPTTTSCQHTQDVDQNGAGPL